MDLDAIEAEIDRLKSVEDNVHLLRDLQRHIIRVDVTEENNIQYTNVCLKYMQIYTPWSKQVAINN